ncbi:MAG: hypothetical protein AABY11_02450 [archaeon]
MPEVIDSLDKMRRVFEGAPFLEKQANRAKALEIHFSRRGVIQVEKNGGAWPTLVYPAADTLESSISEMEKQRQSSSSKKRQWEWTHTKAATEKTVANITKVSDPLYWRHVFKKISNASYRADAKSIDLKSHLIANPKYRPMVEAFVSNEEYRKQLTETVKHSPVYMGHEGIAKHATQRQKLQMEVSQTQSERMGEQVEAYEKQLFALRELLKWSREK